MKSRHLFFVLLLLLAACGSEARRPRTAVTSPPAVKTTEAVAGIPVSGGDATRGAETAYVTIVVFEDLLSARSAELGAVLDKLREKYTWELLRVVVKHHPSPEHAHAKFAATAGQGVLASKGPDAFFRFRDEISRQKSATPESIRKAALATGMTPADFEAGLEKGAWTEKVEKDVSLAKGLGVNEAPASFVNGIPLTGVPSLDVAKDTIEVELAKARVLERSGIPRKAIYDQAVAANFADP